MARRVMFVVVTVLALMAMALVAVAQTPDETTLVVAQSVDVGTLDPANVNSRAEDNIFKHLFGTLYEISEEGTFEPFLATSYSISEDGKEWTFTLNEGLTCHDGEPLTAEDVVYSFQRAADPANAFTGNTPGFVLPSIGYVDARVDGDLQATIVTNSAQSEALRLGLISEVYIHCKDSYSQMTLEQAAQTSIGSGMTVRRMGSG
ncbi:MAG: ABC transporter substrate-binding protein [Anaerolineae bacterium]